MPENINKPANFAFNLALTSTPRNSHLAITILDRSMTGKQPSNRENDVVRLMAPIVGVVALWFQAKHWEEMSVCPISLRWTRIKSMTC
ncbi:MAG: hypothetical protein GY807_13290 [Gammaproteobacteria bacterium]|nr:hypothetical protein [Gammaproteobacteria bacterium]